MNFSLNVLLNETKTVSIKLSGNYYPSAQIDLTFSEELVDDDDDLEVFFIVFSCFLYRDNFLFSEENLEPELNTF